MFSAINTSAFRNKKILVTGHTGFKGFWLSRMLVLLGADVYGLAEEPLPGSLYSKEPNIGLKKSIILDIRNYSQLKGYVADNEFHGIFHLAAQPLVLDAFENPRATFETNFMGTVNLFESILESNSRPWVVAVTTDKVYKNFEKPHGYNEEDTLGGADPYSASKSAMEMAIYSYGVISKAKKKKIRIVSARSGNVIGGGDVSKNRLLPDLVKSFLANEIAVIRNPNSIRPWQHVLDPLFGYLLIAQNLINDSQIDDAYNFGPSESSRITVMELAKIAIEAWPSEVSFKVNKQENAMPETVFLWLNSEKARKDLGWRNKLDATDAIKWTIEWEVEARKGVLLDSVDKQIQRYLEL